MLDKLVQCLCAPDFLSFTITIALFAFFYLLFTALLLFSRRIFAPERLIRKIIESLRWPVFLILLELTAVFFVNLFIASDKFRRPIQHGVVIFIIGTLAWAVAAIIKTSFTHFIKHLEKDSVRDISARSALTQFLFLYRLLMFIIIVVAISAILVSFPYVKTIGIGILGSAGILGIALGIAARPIFLNIMAGFQIALTKMIKIGDAVIVEGDFCRIESIHLTHVIARTWDLRRFILPISYFIDKSFQNWDINDTELIGAVSIYCDYRMPLEPLRKKVADLLKETPLWNGKTMKVEVLDSDKEAMQVRILASANDASTTHDLRTFIREKILEFLQKEFPDMLPCERQREYPEKDNKVS